MNASILSSCMGMENTETEAPAGAGAGAEPGENQAPGLEEKFADLLDEDLIAAALKAEIPGPALAAPEEAEVSAKAPALPDGRETEGKTGPAAPRTKMIKPPTDTAALLNKILPEQGGRITRDTEPAAPKPEPDPSIIEIPESAEQERPEPRTRALESRSGISAADILAGQRRPNPGLKNIGESFPLGWEVLLEDDTPGLNHGERKPGVINTELKSPVLLNKAGADHGSGKKTAWKGKEIPAKAGMEFKNLHSAEKPADPGPGPAAPKTGDPGSKPQPNLQMEMSIYDEVNIKPLSSPRPVGIMPASPSRVLARLSDVQKEMMVKEFVHTTARGMAGKRETLSVELNPPDLGRIKILVELRGDYVNARMVMPDKGLGEFFQEQLEGIRKSMEEAGIKLGELSVEVRQNFNLTPDKQDQPEQGTFRENREPGETNHNPSAKFRARPGSGGESGKVDMLV